MTISSSTGIGFCGSFSETIEYATTSTVRKIKNITSPLSSDSWPAYDILDVVTKALNLCNRLSVNPILPNLVKSLEGTNDIVKIFTYINLSSNWIPCLTAKNFDEKALEASLDDLIRPNEHSEKWKKRVTKEVTASLEKTYTKRALREKVFQMIAVDKVPADLQGAERQAHVDTARRIADGIVLQSKHVPFVQKVYTFLFFIGGTVGVVKTLVKWEMIDLSKIAASIGESKLTGSITKVLGPRVTGVLVKYSLYQVGKYCMLMGTTTKLGFDGYKCCQAQFNIWNSQMGSDERAEFVKERNKRAFATFTGTASLAITVIPLVASVNPVVLITCEIGLGIISLAKALS